MLLFPFAAGKFYIALRGFLLAHEIEDRNSRRSGFSGYGGSRSRVLMDQELTYARSH
jgi:hypothetical protein